MVRWFCGFQVFWFTRVTLKPQNLPKHPFIRWAKATDAIFYGKICCPVNSNYMQGSRLQDENGVTGGRILRLGALILFSESEVLGLS